MAVKERMAKAKFASNMLGVRTTAFIGWKGVWEAAALTRKQEALADEQRRLREAHESQRNEADIKAFAVKENLAIKLMVTKQQQLVKLILKSWRGLVSLQAAVNTTGWAKEKMEMEAELRMARARAETEARRVEKVQWDTSRTGRLYTRAAPHLSPRSFPLYRCSGTRGSRRRRGSPNWSRRCGAPSSTRETRCTGSSCRRTSDDWTRRASFSCRCRNCRMSCGSRGCGRAAHSPTTSRRTAWRSSSPRCRCVTQHPLPPHICPHI